MPEVGNTVRFASGAIGYVVALADLCFAAAVDREAGGEAKQGDTWRILRDSPQPTILRPSEGGKVLDIRGQTSDADTKKQEDGDSHSLWFREMTGINSRTRIDTNLHTGVIALDAFVPVGRGQSMLLQLPPGVQPPQLRAYMTHVVQAQSSSDIHSFMAAASHAEAAGVFNSLGEADGAKKLTVVAAGSDACIGELVLAQNAAMSLAEAHRDDGGNALVLLDLEPLYKVWTILDELAASEELSNTAQTMIPDNQDQSLRIWKYVASKNAGSGRRRSFLGCFLQRAARIAERNGGGSLTLLACGVGRDVSQLSIEQLDVKMNNLQAMNLDETTRQRAMAKLEASMAEERQQSVTGVTEDFLEEAKATTDGHVVFEEGGLSQDGKPRWSVDLKQSVSRGVSCASVQDPYFDQIGSLRLKAFLINLDSESELMEDRETDGAKFDCSPIVALLRQPVGDVFSVEECAAMFLVAVETARRAAAARPLLTAALSLLSKARVRSADEQALRELVSHVRRWSEVTWDEGKSVSNLLLDNLETLANALELKPLERKRLDTTAAEEGALEKEADPSLLEDRSLCYDQLRSRFDSIRPTLPKGLDAGSASEEELSMLISFIRSNIRSRLSTDANF